MRKFVKRIVTAHRLAKEATRKYKSGETVVLAVGKEYRR